jgi:Tol biopolymer transport system component
VTLAPGTRLGPYEILTALGVGGMGEVYKARDTRLDRAVAVKILPTALAADPTFRERFDREARAISRLTHPNICTLYDVGEHDGTAFLVLELLDGQTLADRLKKGAVPLDEALKIAIQIADALNAAHRHGIVHRDLKPGNVILAKAGAKLLDFGLAKASGPAIAVAGLSMLPTTPPNLTAQGTILGTYQYMAPEQLEGQDADARTDIFAFGAVLFEMLTGKKAFEGKSYASLIAAILEHDPPQLAALQPLAPSALDHILKKCLAKDPDERWQNAGDLTSELTWIATSGGALTTAVALSASSRGERRALTRSVSAAAVALLVGAVATYLGIGRFERGANTDVARVLVGVTPAERLQALLADKTSNEGRPSRTAMVWSPDGRSIVFSGAQGDRQQLYVRALDQLDATPIAGTDGASNPFFSPDGRWLGFWSAGALRKIPMGGGPPTTLCESPPVFGASWGSNDTIVFSRSREGLWRISAAGGTPQRVTTPDAKKGEVKHLLPQLLPGNQAVLFTVTHSPLPKWDDTEIVVQSLATSERKVVVQPGADARYVASGHLLYMRRGVLMAAPFDPRRLQTTGGAIGVVANVMQAANMLNEAWDSGAGQFSVSESGSLLYVPGGIFPDPERLLVWVDRTGAVESVPAPVRAYSTPRLSPDGRGIVLWTNGDRNMWYYDLSRRSLVRVTSDGRNARPIWTPDGKRIVFGSAAGGDENLFWQPADGSGTAERLTTCQCLNVAGAWSPDGETLIFVNNAPGTTDIQALSIAGDRRPRVVVAKPGFVTSYPDLSLDGRWLSYASDESGRFEVYVQPFPGPGPRRQISTDGGTAPAWSRSGRELFYTTALSVGGQADVSTMMAVPVTLAHGFTAGAPRALFEGRYGATAIVRGYDVAPDGRRFLMVQQKERAPTIASHMILVQNWVDELKRRVPTK